MASKDNLVEAYEQLMTVSHKMSQSGHYEAAFHALQAALHCAEDLRGEDCLLAVQHEAENQRNFINEQSPEHRMSTQSAQQRGGTNLYDILIRQASVHINQIKHEHRQKNMSKSPNLWDA